ncbi:MAG: Mth938-like domain-containing protein [Devosiaceae bacterium]
MVPNGAKDQFLAFQAPIDAVLDTGFRFGGQHYGMSHQGPLMGLPGRTQAWDAPASAFDLLIDHLEPAFTLAADIDILVIGTGSDIAPLPDPTRDALRDAGLALEVSATRAAVRTYNVLLSEDRRVAAALLPLTLQGS